MPQVKKGFEEVSRSGITQSLPKERRARRAQSSQPQSMERQMMSIGIWRSLQL